MLPYIGPEIVRALLENPEQTDINPATAQSAVPPDLSQAASLMDRRQVILGVFRMVYPNVMPVLASILIRMLS
jgi:hypothetical protein